MNPLPLGEGGAKRRVRVEFTNKVTRALRPAPGELRFEVPFDERFRNNLQ
jgi:hypothetical protein